MKIGIVSQFNPYLDKKAHSGILYRINQAVLDAGHETIWVRNPEPFVYKFVCKVISILSFFHFFRGLYFDRTFIGAKILASSLDVKTAQKCDVILVLHYYHVPFACKLNVPIIYHSDVTFDLARDYYLHNMKQWNIRQAETIERIALNKCAIHISCSDWRDKSVKQHYHVCEDKCFVLEYGDCIDSNGVVCNPGKKDPIDILFNGVVWKRKGGDIAVETCKILQKKGLNIRLTIMGVKELPASCSGLSFIDFVGYLNKNDLSQYEHMKDIFRRSDLLLLPTIAEGAGIVFCEASKYGLPSLTFDTGGIPNYVRNGVNGYRLSLDSSPMDFANKIIEIIKGGELGKLSRGAMELSATRLNWGIWTNFFKRLNEIV